MKSDAVRIAQLSARTQLQSQCLNLLIDPLWSTIAGFVVVASLSKHEMLPKIKVGPWDIADEALLAGIIAINTARTPGLLDLAGKGLGAIGSAVGTGMAVAGGVVAGGVASKVIPAIPKLAAKGQGQVKTAVGNVRALTSTTGTLTLLPPLDVVPPPKELAASGYAAAKPWTLTYWKRILGLA